MMTTPEFYAAAIEAVRSGRLAEAEIDAPCARLLALKFRMGLFENPRPADLQRVAAEMSRRGTVACATMGAGTRVHYDSGIDIMTLQPNPQNISKAEIGRRLDPSASITWSV